VFVPKEFCKAGAALNLLPDNSVRGTAMEIKRRMKKITAGALPLGWPGGAGCADRQISPRTIPESCPT